MNRAVMLRLTATLLCCLLLIACSREDAAVETATTSAEPPAAVDGNEQAGTAAGADFAPAVGTDSGTELTVFLSPLPASREQNLHAMVSGDLQGPQYRWFVGGTELVEITGSELPSDYIAKGAEIEVIVSKGGISGQATTVAVNSPPRLVPGSVDCSLNQPILPETSDADGDHVAIRYLWTVNGQELEHGENLLTYDQAAGGDQVALQIFISDGELELPVYECYEFTVDNGAPEFVSTPPNSFSGNLYEYQPQAIDPEGTRVSYQLDSAPDGMTLDPETGLIRWEITAESVGEHTVTLVATDEDGRQNSQTYTINLSLQGTP